MLVILFLHPLTHFCSRGLVLQPLFPGESGVDQLVEIIKVVFLLSILLGLVVFTKKMTSLELALTNSFSLLIIFFS